MNSSFIPQDFAPFEVAAQKNLKKKNNWRVRPGTYFISSCCRRNACGSSDSSPSLYEENVHIGLKLYDTLYVHNRLKLYDIVHSGLEQYYIVHSGLNCIISCTVD